MEDRRALFDEWAEHDNASVDDESGFPCTGYRDALVTTLNAAAPAPGQSVLDVGCGTGNLSLLLALAGCKVTGVDYSPAMLDMAQQRVPGERFLELDLLGSWETLAGQRFDVIASAYVLHEFPLVNKLGILARLVEEHLGLEGRVVVADIRFPTRADMDAAQAELEEIWDEEEFAWNAEGAVAAIRQRRLSMAYTPIPPNAGVYRITPTSA